MPTYSIRPYAQSMVCSQAVPSPWYVFDAPAWEEFDTVDLAPYFWEGLGKLREEIRVLENPLRRYTEDDQKRLSFMVESLIQVRRLMDERGV